MDKLESIYAFTQVVRQGSFAAAARKMNLGRSAVNKMVIALENELKVQLLHRSTRKVTPTPTGVAFYEKSVQILADLEEAELSVSQLHGEPKGLLRINAPMTFGTMYVAPLVAKFMALHSQVEVQLTLEDRFVDAIAEGYDLLIRIAQPVASASLISQPLFQTKLLLCASPEYLAHWGTPKTPGDLQQHNCLLYGYFRGSHWQLLSQGGEETISVSGSFCSNNGEALAIAVAQGLGIALLPQFIVQPYLAAGKMQVILPDYCLRELTVSLVYPVNRHLATKVKLLTEFLQDHYRK
ncbi:LysR family transcriptional regulator [Synechocystis sp. PCC 7339]|uniref:LysR family transcriptional regulator n=1 Tax=unclassified Synechocystis TaxID=2640012 RepID=UPI001BAFFD36|nr:MULTISPECIES: LysR family transcriptional regulator [unclassified Synechocystis]QUS61781.1 LysR family transcriptional regulator [Synechocystis sp. PCC 7338]UAJ73978.1 LysR family transcriptional regulator [Synechocystis sp. PCC 7339]